MRIAFSPSNFNLLVENSWPDQGRRAELSCNRNARRPSASQVKKVQQMPRFTRLIQREAVTIGGS